MKRYIYILLSATLTLLGCKPNNTIDKPEVAFCFTPIEVTTTETTATIKNRSYMSIDGIRSNETTFYLEYAKMDEEEFIRGGDFSRLSDGWFEFTLTNLEPGTSYKARLTVDGGEYGSETGSPFPFTTKEAAKIESISCDAEVDAQGLFATIRLSNVAYLVNEEPQPIAFIKLEYTPKISSEWQYIVAAGSSIKEGKIEFTIPQSGAEYLVEDREYSYRVTITPNNGDYNALTTDTFVFKTTLAEVKANFSKLNLTYDDNGIDANIKEVSITLDGVAAEEYKFSEPIIYNFYYRKRGASVWEEVETEFSNGEMRATIPASLLSKGATYEVIASVTVGIHKQVCQTAAKTITVPAGETPDRPIVPEPPTGGDTSAIEGVWHLTEWRGVTPSFEVYMDITATGGITLYQRIESRNWDIYTSSVALNDGVVCGTYTDGVAWGSAYNVTITESSMTWVSVNDATDVSVYTRAELPEGLTTVATRSVVSNVRFL
jgi:hypothetical protein